MADEDPTTIRSLAVTVEDLVTALELNRTTARRAVLRVTPPFSGRMRARLHVVTDADDSASDTGGTLHIDPEALIEPDAPDYPTAVDTEEALRADPQSTYTVERHHERHLDAVDSWRTTVADAVRSSAGIETPAGPHEVDIATLGDLSDGDSSKPDETSS